jgi:rRNA processing protein Krr1/Pno1
MKYLYQDLDEFYNRLSRSMDDDDALSLLQDDEYFEEILDACKTITDLKDSL